MVYYAVDDDDYDDDIDFTVQVNEQYRICHLRSFKSSITAFVNPKSSQIS